VASVADSRFKQRAVIEFLVHKNVSVVNIHERLCAVYGSYAVDRSTVGLWSKRVKASGSTVAELSDLLRAGRPVFWDCEGVNSCRCDGKRCKLYLRGIHQLPQQAQETFPASTAWQESSRNVAPA
jgi:hypothetical protein